MYNKKRYTKRILYILFVYIIIFLNLFLYSKKPTAESETDRFIDSLLVRMTTEEKLGQLTLHRGGTLLSLNSLVTDNEKELIRKGKIGAMFNVFGAEMTYELQRIAVEESRLGIPLIFAMDVVHGFKTIFPVPLAYTCSWDPQLVQKAAQIAALEATASGIHWTFAPMIDIARDPRWGRIVEGSGEDPFLASVMAETQIKGYQGDDLSDSRTLLACAKHFVAYGGAIGGRDYNTVDVSERTLQEIYLPPFKSAVKSGVGTIMSAFNEVSGIPMTANNYLLTDVLRKSWGFDGFVVSDWNAIPELIIHGVARDRAHAGELAINAGVDMDMIGFIFQKEMLDLINTGRISETLVNTAVRRVLKVKYRLGLFDDPYRYCDTRRESSEVMNEGHIEFAREAARKSIVLLKNDQKILPLRKDLKRIAVIGPLADDNDSPLGSWFAAGESRDVISVLDGIQDAVSSGTTVMYEKGCDVEGYDESSIKKAVNTAKNADAVVLVLGEHYRMSGEAKSRSSLKLPGIQQKLARQIVATDKPVIVLLMNGRPLSVTWLAENVPAILECWFLGVRMGSAVADVLFGDYNPGGKLAVSFPRTVGQVPCYYNHKNTGRPASPDKTKDTARYIDLHITPLFPFGHGLSYTQFKYNNLVITPCKIRSEGSVQIVFELENIGERTGDEVAQLYIRDIVASITRPVQALKGFKRIHLTPGEKKNVIFELPVEQCGFLDREMNYLVEPGIIEVMIGSSSADIRLKGHFEVQKS